MPQRVLVVVAVLSLARSFTQTPSAPSTAGTGLVLGQVIDGSTNKPIAGATVTMSGTIATPAMTSALPPPPGIPPAAGSTFSRAALTDGDGSFVFAAIPAGRFNLTVSKSGYLNSSTGQRLPAVAAVLGSAGTRFDLGDGERKGGFTLPLWKTAAIGGTVVDEAGEPIIGLSDFVILFPSDRALWLPQSRRIRQVRPAADGKFSVKNIPPGDYRVAAVTDVDPGEWFDPNFLQQLVNTSIPVKLVEGQKTQQDLKIQR